MIRFCAYNGICETTDNTEITPEKAALLGKYIGMKHKNICIAGCLQNLSILYSVAGGAAEYAENIYFCENSDIMSFRFSVCFLEADFGIYVNSSKIILFNRLGETFSGSVHREFKEKCSASKRKSEKIYHTSSFREIYLNKIKKENKLTQKISCGISCGKKSTKELWLELFTGEDDKLVLQVSDDGSKANLYSSVYGAISYEKLVTAYIIMKYPQNRPVYLPEDFHYQTENAISNNVIRYRKYDDLTAEAANKAFWNDMLIVCSALLSEKERLFSIIENMPQMASAKRIIQLKNAETFKTSKNIQLNNGKIVISRISNSLLSVCAQSDKFETASEICGEWCGILLRNNGIPNNKH
jgi:hypothetical protein